MMIFNKASGVYGILALFTGHPLDFMQWMFYIWSVFCLVIFIAGIRQVYKPNMLTMSCVTFVFSVDTVVSCLYCLWFTAVWFSEEGSTDHSKLKSAGTPLGLAHEGDAAAGRSTVISSGKPSQSASSGYEFFFTILFTLIPLTVRFYFNFIIIAFQQQLQRSDKFTFDQNDIEVNLHNRNVFFRGRYRFEKWCYYLCKRYL